MKRIFFLIISVLSFQSLSLADNIRYFQIEGMKIGDSALDYFTESQLENNEQGWHNYTYKEYSTSLMTGKGIYDWFLVSYKNDDNNFIIEGLTGGLEKMDYDNEECNKKLEINAFYISEKFRNTLQNKKKTYQLGTNASRTFPFTGKGSMTSISFDFLDEGKIILSCYYIDKEYMNKEINQSDTTVPSILNQKDSFRIDARSSKFENYLKINK